MVDSRLENRDYIPHASRMVNDQIKSRGITDPYILDRMQRIPRHLFIGDVLMEQAYGDYPLSIGYSQTISQPYIVAYMTELLKLTGDEKILEIGTGSGYQTCLLAELAGEIFTVEKVPELFRQAKLILDGLGYENIHFFNGDGSAGWKKYASYDRIIVTAALPQIPEIIKLQLADNGILIAPVGHYQSYQTMIRLQRKNNEFQRSLKIKCRFVPIIGKYGF